MKVEVEVAIDETGVEAAALAIATRFVDEGRRRPLARAILRLVEAGRDRPIRRGRIAIDPLTRRVRIDDAPVALLPREYAVLALLARVDGIVPADRLRREVLGLGFDPGTNAIAVHVSRLRAKLGRDIVDTVRGDGYRLGRGALSPVAGSTPDDDSAAHTRTCA